MIASGVGVYALPLLFCMFIHFISDGDITGLRQHVIVYRVHKL